MLSNVSTSFWHEVFLILNRLVLEKILSALLIKMLYIFFLIENSYNTLTLSCSFNRLQYGSTVTY